MLHLAGEQLHADLLGILAVVGGDDGVGEHVQRPLVGSAGRQHGVAAIGLDGFAHGDELVPGLGDLKAQLGEDGLVVEQAGVGHDAHVQAVEAAVVGVAHQGVHVVVLDVGLIGQVGEQAFVDVLLPGGLVDGLLVPVGLGLGEGLEGDDVHVGGGDAGLDDLIDLAGGNLGHHQLVLGIGLVEGVNDALEILDGGRVGPGQDLDGGAFAGIGGRIRGGSVGGGLIGSGSAAGGAARAGGQRCDHQHGQQHAQNLAQSKHTFIPPCMLGRFTKTEYH